MSAQPLLQVAGAHVRFAGDVALNDVDFRMFAGEVHSLMGENGAGKSTLIKAMTGALRLDTGVITLAGEPVSFESPAVAQRAGIGTVYQEIDLLPNLSVAENVMLGREPRRLGRIDWKRMRRAAADSLAELGIDIDPASALGSHKLATQQLVAIARAISTDVRVLVLDEPTSSLDQDEVIELFRVIRELKARGVAILFISHFLEQVYEICDRVTVLRNGRMVGEYLTTDLLRIDLVQKMLGRELADHDPEVAQRWGIEAALDVAADELPRSVVLSADGVTSDAIAQPAQISLIEGELVGFAGLLGSGRSELARLITGVDALGSGRVVVDGQERALHSPHQAMALGLVYSSENRKSEGIIGELSVCDNIALALQAQQGWLRPLGAARKEELATSWIEALDIRPPDPHKLAGQLSGGNQQKVLLARLLALAPRILVLDEPTRGIDVGAKVEIQKLVSDLAGTGIAVVFISAELEEVLRVSQRILVLRDRRIVAELSAEDLTIGELLAEVAKAESDE